jgi:hypothetical protein
MCCWPLPAQSFSGLSPLGLAIIFYCLRFETSLFVASYDSHGHGGGIRHGSHRKHVSHVRLRVHWSVTSSGRGADVIESTASSTVAYWTVFTEPLPRNASIKSVTIMNYSAITNSHTHCSSLRHALRLLSLLYLHRLSAGNGFQRRSFLSFRFHVHTDRRLSHKALNSRHGVQIKRLSQQFFCCIT